MEAKVDIRKLQILSDRINQATEALNQVRASVHGLGHTTAQAPYAYGLPAQAQNAPWMTGSVPGLQHTTGMAQGYAAPQFANNPYAVTGQQQVNPYIQNQFAPWQTQYNPYSQGQFGLQHSMGNVQPFAQTAYPQQQQQQQFYGMQQPGMTNPYAVNPQALPFGMGLQHTTALPQASMFGNAGNFQGQAINPNWQPDILEQRALEARASDPFRIAQTFPFAWQLQIPVGNM